MTLSMTRINYSSKNKGCRYPIISGQKIYLFPPYVVFKTNAKVPPANNNLCRLITTKVFSIRSAPDSAKTIESKISVT